MPTTLQFPVVLMPFTDASNTAHPSAVWYLASISQDALDLDAGLTFYGYDNANDLINDLAVTLTGTGTRYSPIGEKSYSLTMPQFATFAQSTLDTPTSPPTTDSKGNPVLVSFFATATQGSITVTV